MGARRARWPMTRQYIDDSTINCERGDGHPKRNILVNLYFVSVYSRDTPPRLWYAYIYDHMARKGMWDD